MSCAKAECTERACHRITIIPGATISVCRAHLAWALKVVDTGRP